MSFLSPVINNQYMRSLTVASFGYSPMKGTRYAARLEAQVKKGFLQEDRRLCLVDVERRRVIRTVQHPELMAIEVFLTGDLASACIVFPDKKGREVNLTPKQTIVCEFWGRSVELGLLGTPVNQFFSRYLGRDVSLALASPGAILFGAPFSLLGSATVEELARQLNYPHLVQETARFRSTFLIKTERPFEEEEWEGKPFTLTSGWGTMPETLQGLHITVGAHIGRCAVVDSNPSTGARDLKLLKHLAQTRPATQTGEPRLGMYAHPLS